jgi:hypothetical protein
MYRRYTDVSSFEIEVIFVFHNREQLEKVRDIRSNVRDIILVS